ncbi:hypothetical protein WT77_20675 [Burkholderia stagnalis]|nr:hypothetical protein WT18_03025 [Burkholderia stagnalis]KVP10916.1 hypothetical protein WT20_15195 [Burkholderia stagnalis]KVW98629.1 hypothetical protein WT30_07075 [Burkholderia stagnalis]KWH83094.1 hypothetical protein WT66_08875 [Burkholderia stagnalis]KWK21845.1 hypothetical protein WT77_20675 [Burkholderia stagnalis]
MSAMTTPLISVVIPTYNRAHTIERAIRSVLGQTYAQVEIVIVDDCSTDDTERVVRAIGAGCLTYVRNDRNLRGGASRNRGVSLAKGELIAFLDSDDEWKPDKLALQVREIGRAADPARTVCYTRLLLCHPGGHLLQPDRGLAAGEPVADYLFRHGGYMQTSSLLMPAELLRAHPFDVSLKKHQDWDLTLRLERDGCAFRYIDAPLTIWHQDGEQRVSDLVDIGGSVAWIERFRNVIPTAAFWGFMVRIVVPELAKTSIRSRLKGMWILAMALASGTIGMRRFVFEICRMGSPVRLRRWLKEVM